MLIIVAVVEFLVLFFIPFSFFFLRGSFCKRHREWSSFVDSFRLLAKLTTWLRLATGQGQQIDCQCSTMIALFCFPLFFILMVGQLQIPPDRMFCGPRKESIQYSIVIVYETCVRAAGCVASGVGVARTSSEEHHDATGRLPSVHPVK